MQPISNVPAWRSHALRLRYARMNIPSIDTTVATQKMESVPVMRRAVTIMGSLLVANSCVRRVAAQIFAVQKTGKYFLHC
jgi:hypothetical protein